MTKRTEAQYFNFPVQLLNGFIENTEESLSKISRYAVYDRSINLENASSEDMFKRASSFFSVSFPDPKTALSTGKKLYNDIGIKSPKVGISLPVFWDFYKNEKTEFEKVCLLAFLALKSIVKNQAYCKATNEYMYARMDGKTHSCEFNELSSSLKKYTNDYQARKIKRELAESWGLVTYSRYTRGFYVSFSMDFKTLVELAEKRKESSKQKQRIALEKQIIAEVLRKIKITKP